jgi:septal ring factor EnvC (AmiA/AmiB activator)
VLAGVTATLLAGVAVAQLDTTLRDRLQEDAARYERLVEAREAELQQLQEALRTTRRQIDAQLAERDRLSRRVAEIAAERRALQARQTELRSDIADTEARIAAKQAELASLEARVQQLLVDVHRRQAQPTPGALGASSSIHEFLVRQRFLTLLAEQDVRVIDAVNATLSDLQGLQTRLEVQEADLAANVRELNDREAALGEARAGLDAVIAQLGETQAGQQAQREALLEAQAALESQLASIETRLEDEIARLEAEERRLREAAEQSAGTAEGDRLEEEADSVRERRLALSSPSEPNAAGFVAPLENAAIVTTFGEDNNSFVALRASRAQAPVFAMQDGVITAVQSIGSNDGWMVAVRHSDDLTTVYTNLQQPPRTVGERVARGDFVGSLGGGTIPPPDVLRLYARDTSRTRAVFVDPATLLGF